MRVLTCTSCGHQASRELSRCPFCRQKNLVFNHSYNSSGVQHLMMLRSGESARGSHPLVSLAVVGVLSVGLTLILFSWMYPEKSLEDLAGLAKPKSLAAIEK